MFCHRPLAVPTGYVLVAYHGLADDVPGADLYDAVRVHSHELGHVDEVVRKVKADVDVVGLRVDVVGQVRVPDVVKDLGKVSVLQHDDVVGNLLAPRGGQDADRTLYFVVGGEFRTHKAVFHNLLRQVTAAGMITSADASVDGLKRLRTALPQWCSRPDPGLVQVVEGVDVDGRTMPRPG